MPESPYKHLHEKFSDITKSAPISSEHQALKLDALDYGKGLSKTFYIGAIQHYKKNESKDEAIENAKSLYTKYIEDPWSGDQLLNTNGGSWHDQLGKLLKAYDTMRKTIKYYEEADGHINWIDRKAHSRALFYRVSTTAMIAVVLGSLYTAAGNFDNVYLPLQHKTVIHYYDGKAHKTAPDPVLYEKTKTEVEVTGTTRGSTWRVTTPLPKP